jgi:alkylation response protein AidB-like acyl-CoA dehydrogenase
VAFGKIALCKRYAGIGLDREETSRASQLMEHSPAVVVPDSRGIDLFAADPGFRALLALYVEAKLFTHLLPHFERLGKLAGNELDQLALTADKHPPILHHRTRAGTDAQSIEKHPAYRRLESVAFGEYGLAAMSHRGGVLGWPAPMPPVVKYALTYIYVQAEFGVCCPLSMTDSAARTLARFGDPALIARYLPGIIAQDLDALTQGAMFITEQGAGSDVGATATRAVPAPEITCIGGAGAWRLYGDKWFCSNADAGVALVLARPQGASSGTRGLALFLLPRLLPDGSLNAYRIVRLKDKLGTRDMASGEIRLDGAIAYLVGEASRGFVQMTDMINMSRLSNGMRAAGMMRRALTEALFVANRRAAFGKRLIELPLMRRQLLKLMVPAEAARSVMLFTATELESADAGDDAARRRLRVLTPLIKFRACRDARRVTADAMEVRGGVGYIEEWSDARLLRDSHLGSIWEGTSNIVALDVMRAIRRERALEALLPALHAKLDIVAPPLRNELAAALGHAESFARVSAIENDAASARQAASGLYYAVAAIVLAAEGTRLSLNGDARRLLLSALTLMHRLMPRDPLKRASAEFENVCASSLLDEQPVPASTAERALALWHGTSR